jgi:hypothetical protein
MAETVSLKDAVTQRGPYAVWDLMTEEEQREAATALWDNGDRDTRTAIEMALAKDLKFRPQSVHRLSADRVVGRLLRLAETVPQEVLFQFLFHLHMAHRRALMGEFLDAVGLPHEDGVLQLPEDMEPPDAGVVAKAARDLLAAHDHPALVYLATLRVADAEFWKALEEILEGYSESGSPLEASDGKAGEGS